MNDKRRPPEDITPETFFSRWLPDELARLGSAPNIPPTRVRAVLEGDGGGSFDLVFEEGRVTGGPADPAATPQVALGITVQDWRAAMVGEAGAVDLLPDQATATDLMFLDAAAQRLVTMLGGAYAFEVRDYNGRTWRLTAAFGGAPVEGPPTATIATDFSTYRAILDKTLTAPDALFSGKVTISGDQGKGMQVGLALFSKF